MSLGATLAAGGMRPASFLPTIKCSNCGDEIEISAMGDHLCTKSPPSPKSQPASLSNPFTLRQMNAAGSKPAQPSPLQFDNPPRQGRPRAPTAGSQSAPPSRLPRAPLPNINADAANKPFLAPLPRPESPISPATSSRSGSRPPQPQRSVTSPMPRLWDPRPPSPELSASFDCAFPPFPFGDPPGSRPGSSNGRNSPSERGSSRAGSRQGGKLPEPPMPEPQSPISSKAGETVMNRMNTLKSGPFDPGQRRPSRDERAPEESRPLDRRRPSISKMLPFLSKPPPMPAGPLPASLEPGKSQNTPSGQTSTIQPSEVDVPEHAGKRAPPQRPTRPTESLGSDILVNATKQFGEADALDFPLPPKALQAGDRSKTFPATQEQAHETVQQPALFKVPSEPSLRGRSASRPPLPESVKSEPAQLFPSRSTSRVGASRVDYRMQDAPPVPKPVQELHRSNSMHRPSGSDSSTASSAHSVENNSSSRGASPVTSAASSVDAFSPLSSEKGHYGEDRSMRVAGLTLKAQDNPGLRAELPKQRKSPPRNFARPVPPKGEIEKPLESPVLPAIGSNWPLESPMDPAMKNGMLGGATEHTAPPKFAQPEPPRALKPGMGLSPADFLSDDYDPYRPLSPRTDMPPPPQQLGPPPRVPSPQQASSPNRMRSPPQAQPLERGQSPSQAAPPHTRARSRTTNQAPTRPFSPANSMPSRSQTPQLNRAQTSAQGPPQPPQLNRAQTFGPGAPQQLPQAPPIPQDAVRAPLARRPTMGGKAICRGCSLPIEGKSVKAADGRLTGRWHKQCFVCKTCEQPFTSADFYVIANHPYCEQHYHEKNGSTCAGCRRGIEGQYLETTKSGPGGVVGERKFHPRCFTCFNCRGVLSEDYFEIGGRVFCERHALAAMRAQPRPMGGPPGAKGQGRLAVGPHGASNLGAMKAERRTTKLMMMG